MNNNIYQKVKERFIRYVQINTESEANTNRTPSTKCQFDLAKVLYSELKNLGASDVYLDEKNCLVYAKIKASEGYEDAIPFGLIAHMDTAPDVSGKDVHPWVYEHYDGKDVILNEKENIVLKTNEFPNVLNYIGQDIVFTDGTTLLGGDDKAAVAEVMTMADVFLHDESLPHGPISIAFTPDEEVAGLAKDLDFKRFGAKIAYTIDGDYVGYYSDETFNATEAQLTFIGKNVHPGTAKGKMKNALEIAAEFINSLPPERPQNTEGRVGFYHPHGILGAVEATQLLVLLRDHDEDEFNKKKEVIEQLVKNINEKYGSGTALLNYQNGYSSMKKVVDKVPFMIEDLVEAIKDCGETPTHLAFRGGTDGSSISQRGLPCPNISAGYENGHSRYEFVPIQSMEKITYILIALAKRLSNRK